MKHGAHGSVLAVSFLCLILPAAAERNGTLLTEVPVTLEASPFPPGFQPAFRRPLRVPLSTRALPMEGLKPPDDPGGTPWFGLVPRGEPPALPILLVCGEKEGRKTAFLYVDHNRDLDLGNDGPPLKTLLLRKKGKFPELYAFFPKVALPPAGMETAFRAVLHERGKGRKERGYGMFFTRSFMKGKAVLPGEGACFLFLLDDDGDGLITRKDRWSLQPRGDVGQDVSPFVATSLWPFLWKEVRLASGSTWHVSTLDKRGRSLTLAPGAAPPPPASTAPETAPVPRPLAETPVPWMHRKKEALARAAKEGRPVLLLLVSKDDASQQARMEQAYRDLDVAELASAFVPLLLRVKDVPGAPLPYGIPGLPCSVVLDRKGKLIRRFPGYRSPERLVKDLESAIP